MKKNHLIGGGILAVSLLFFYGAINFVSCGSNVQCRANPDFIGGKVVKALEINFKTETSNGWSGKDAPTLTITSSNNKTTDSSTSVIVIPPPPPPPSNH